MIFYEQNRPIAVSIAAIANNITATNKPLLSIKRTLENINCKFIAKTNNSNAIKYSRKLFLINKQTPPESINKETIIFSPVMARSRLALNLY